MQSSYSMIIYKSNSQAWTLFRDYLQYMIEAKGPDIIAGDFNIVS